MENFLVDPLPFIPGRYQIFQVENRPQQCRYHVADAIRARHEDVAIATVTPAPSAEIPFGLVRNFLRNLIEGQLGFTLEMIQRCPIGTAFVRVGSFADKDWLVSHSPHQFNGRAISLVNHNQGINHRSFTYNQECWLLLVAYPLDLWSTEHLKRAVKDFGVFVAWDEESSSYGAVVIKVRVAALEHIPHSCVVSDDEDLPPPDGSPPNPMPQQPFEPPVHFAPAQPMDMGWPQWQPNIPNVGQNHNADANDVEHHMNFLFPANLEIGLNNLPDAAGLDLNVPPAQLNDDEFLEINDLINPVDVAQPGDSDITLTLSSEHTASDESGGSVNGGAPAAHRAGLAHPNIHIGMVLLPDTALPDPMWNTLSMSREGTNAWNNFFRPRQDSSSSSTVSVPISWVDFLTSKLLTPDDFVWVKGLLQSDIWAIIS
ncbi:hypothetical protein ACQ4PT_006867 [Festuca glaucescens]